MNFDDNPSAPLDSPQSSSPDRPAENPATVPADTTATTPLAPNLVLVPQPPPFVAVAQRRMADPDVPQDLRVPWGWLSLLLFVMVTAVGLLGLGVIAVIIYMGTGGSIEALQRSARLQGLLSVIVQFFVDFGWLGFFAVMLRAVYRQPFWRTIGWRPLESSRFPRAASYLALVIGGIVLAVIVTATSNLFPPKGELAIEQLLQDRNTAMLFALMSVAVAPLVEETLFRGYLYPLVARTFGVGTSIVFTGAVFGLLHAPQLSGAWFQVLLLIGVGIVFTIARAATKTVAASFVLHISYNSLQVLGLILDTHGFRQMHLLH
jgi:membrane protease YdiL (CAAX protease family)